MGMATFSVTIWFCVFFQFPDPAQFLAGDLGLNTAWRWATYPMVNLPRPIWMVIDVVMFWWFVSPQERAWGGIKFCRVFLVITLAYAGTWWLGHAFVSQSLSPDVAIQSWHGPSMAMFMIWGAMNPRQNVNAYFVIPVEARYLVFAFLFLFYLNVGQIVGPVIGLFACIIPVCSWFWAKGGAAAAPGPGGSSKKSLFQWWKERKREKQKSKFKPLQGGRGHGISNVPPGERPKLRSTVVGKIEESSSEAELNRILDKINAEGMDALTDAERETLDSRSRRLRDND